MSQAYPRINFGALVASAPGTPERPALWAQREAIRVFEENGATHGLTHADLTNNMAAQVAMDALARLIEELAERDE